jgi:hypothetical protein
MSQTLFSKPPGVNATQIGTATTTLIKNGPGQISSVMVGTAQASGHRPPRSISPWACAS